ncbi:hypothetical protein [Parafrankia sp. FMc2]|uniref:hypothetical protein n=1 Tax=Parafrankia sp. FMc2 TaxID=3233196 RepID=UPI0034D7896F
MKHPGKVGLDFERTQGRVLRDQYGYQVRRSSASAGPYDHDASKPLPPELRALWGRRTQRLLVQVKYTGRPPSGIPYLPPGEWNELYDLAVEWGALAVLVARPGFRKAPLWWRIIKRKGEGVASIAKLCVPFDPAEFVALPGEVPLPAETPLGRAV